MDNMDKTVHFSGTVTKLNGSRVTIFDGFSAPRTVRLDIFGKNYVYFGRDPRNDIVLTSHLVSAEHGRFAYRNNAWVIEDKAMYGERGSTNGLMYNNASIVSRVVSDGDFIRIDDVVETVAEGVLFVFTSDDSENRWASLPLTGRPIVTIGRDSGCDIVLPHISVSKCHAKIAWENDGYYIYDNGSTNGVVVNGSRITGKVKLHEKDVIAITNSKLIYTSAMLSYCCYKSGISVDASNIVIRRGRGAKSFVTSDHVSLGIRPGELIAIIGGSGAGKSTILNCMCGYLKPNEGDVFINGINLYQNFDSLKKLIGYVPQSDIVYDNLTLHDMLMYTAMLRLPEDTTPVEREAAITRAINTVELSEKRGSLIKSLSGGQRKRASIAVELKMCDKIVFMGKGGNLCFFGSHDDAKTFFGVDDIVDVYNMITDNAKEWRARYEQLRAAPGRIRPSTAVSARSKENKLRQLGVLSARYLKLVTNDRQRLLLLMIQAPLLAVLISFVADGKQFDQYEMTKSLLFALSCSAFWVGMLNAIQEICKERTILKREYMTGLSLGTYVSSKIIVLGIMCLVQSIMITTVFSLMIGLPDEGVMIFPFLELLITTFITATASTAMGLFVSSLFTNADRAMTVAPILLMPQILFSGLIFKLDGATEIISWLAVCRWSMEGYGTTANLNDLPLRLQQQGVMIPHEAESFFDFTPLHLICSWGILIVYTVVFLVLARLVLSKIGKEKS